MDKETLNQFGQYLITISIPLYALIHWGLFRKAKMGYWLAVAIADIIYAVATFPFLKYIFK